jgi:hypothetical protein
MTEFLTVSNLLDQTITRLEKKKQNGRDGILSTESYPPHMCARPNPGPIFIYVSSTCARNFRVYIIKIEPNVSCLL